MEIEELKSLWQEYDRKLDHLEKLNKKLVLETLTKKPQKKLNWMKFKSIYGLMISPVIIIVVLHRFMRFENMNQSIIIGWVLVVSVLIYLSYWGFKGYIALKSINLSDDSIIESARKVNQFKSITTLMHKYTYISFPLFYTGIILVVWKSLHINLRSILFMIGLFVFAWFFAKIKFKIYNEKIGRLEEEILELNKYVN